MRFGRVADGAYLSYAGRQVGLLRRTGFIRFGGNCLLRYRRVGQMSEREMDRNAALGGRVGVGVGDVGAVDIGLEEGAQSEGCGECVLSADTCHPNL